MDHHQLALLKLAGSVDKGTHAEPNLDPPPSKVGPSDDGYHFSQYCSGPADEWYLEWWYFNFRDPATGLAGILMFEVLNPENKLGLGRAGTSLIVFSKEGKPLVVQDLFPIAEFSAAVEKAQVRIGSGNSVDALDDDTHHVVLTADNGKARLDLTYTRTAPGAFMSKDMSGRWSWETASWLAYSPQARVRGTVTLEGRTFTLEDALGYHDHNWGKWLLPARTFVWAAFADPQRDVHFNYGLSRLFSPGNRSLLRVDGLDLVFPPERIEEPLATDFERYDGLFGFWEYPTRVSVIMVDTTGQYRLVMEWRVLETANLPKSPLVIFEQRAHMKGKLSKLADGNWEFLTRIEGEGFCEWTDTWIPLPGI